MDREQESQGATIRGKFTKLSQPLNEKRGF
jgi:hypothetical protein